ncbi:BAALC binder of MAP3K1 and KLF4 a [Engraulis encrasicolus]|uniref:BAALC binder of MAP3K1 and KLF4 a n=1 Tax=Engraulis encrasicolus TaxID=184585 RepID=UPI002FD4F023
MGCGGSRADTIEPRYYESWTRETESTWLTNTDTELAQASASSNNNNQRGISDSSSTPAKQCARTCQGASGKGEDRRPSALGSSREKKLVSTATQCGKPPLHSSNSSCGSKGKPLQRDENKVRPRKLSCKDAGASKSSCPEGSPSDGK